jgi:hypothetical protein
MLYRSAAYAIEKGPAEALVVGGLMLMGVPLCALSARLQSRARSDCAGCA